MSPSFFMTEALLLLGIGNVDCRFLTAESLSDLLPGHSLLLDSRVTGLAFFP